MAQGKKSFIAYSDWKDIFDELPNEEAGSLIKHIFAYVNDENPQTDSILIKAVFANIKSTLKRDLDKWNSQLEQRSEAGKKSAELRALKKLNENERNSTSVEKVERNPTVNVNDNVNVSVNVNDILLEKETKYNIRFEKFRNEVLSFRGLYDDALLKEFFDYWSEPNKSNTKMKFELNRTWKTELRLRTWENNSKKFNNGTQQRKLTVDEQLAERKQRFARELTESIENSTNADSEI